MRRLICLTFVLACSACSQTDGAGTDAGTFADASRSHAPDASELADISGADSGVDADADQAFADVGDTGGRDAGTDADIAEPVEVVFAPVNLAVTEGSMATFDVWLSRVPDSQVEVSVALPSGSVVLSPASLVFDPSDATMPQSVTIEVPDDDFAEDPFDVRVEMTVDGAPIDGPLVRVEDDDVPGFLFDVEPDFIWEDLGGFGITVRLASRPRNVVWVEFTQSVPDELTFRPRFRAVSSLGNWGASEPYLTFSPEDWDVPRGVTVYAEDNVIEPDVDVSVSSNTRSADPFYEGLTGPSFDLTVRDHEDVSLHFIPAVPMREGGGSQAVTLNLWTVPTAPVQIDFWADNQDVTISPTSVVLNPADFPAALNLSLTPVDDDVNEPIESVGFGATFQSSDPSYDGRTANSWVRIVDDDGAGLTVEPLHGWRVSEGAPMTADIRLNVAPVAPVVVNLTTDAVRGEISPAALTFDATNYAVPQTVMLSMPDDDLAEESELEDVQVEIVTTDPDYAAIATQWFPTNWTDNDLPLAVFSTDNLEIAEGEAEVVEVVLKSAPRVPVEVRLVSHIAMFDVSPSSVTFTAADWSTPRAISVSMLEDAEPDVDPQGYLWGGIYEQDDLRWAFEGTPFVTLRGRDNDGNAVAVRGPERLTLAEGRRPTQTAEVLLRSAPTADVTVAFTSDDPLEVAVTPSSVTFTPDDWWTPRTFEVSTADDVLVEGERAVGVSVEVTSTDAAFQGANPPAMVVDVYDDETAAVVVRPRQPLDLWEPNTRNPQRILSEVEVFLTRAPTDDVWVSAWSTDLEEALCGPRVAHFAPAAWDEIMIVELAAFDDDVDTMTTYPTLVVDPAVSADPAYAGYDRADIPLVCYDAE